MLLSPVPASRDTSRTRWQACARPGGTEYSQHLSDKAPQGCAKNLGARRGGIPHTGAPISLDTRHQGRPPAALRFHPSLFHHSDASRDYYLPALIACAEDTAGHFAGIQRTWLDPTRTDLKLQLEPRKAALGTEAGSIVRLSPYLNSTIVLCEGIEDGLSIIQATGQTVWATLGTNMRMVRLPECVTTVVLAGDNDAAGQKAVEAAARHFHADGRMVRIVFPPPGTKDFNDSLRRGR